MRFDQIKTAAQPHLLSLIAEALPAGRKMAREWRAGSIYGDAGGSLSVSLTTGQWHDHATGQSGDLISLWAERFGLSLPEAGRDLAARIGSSAGQPRAFREQYARAREAHKKSETDELTRKELARSIWADALPVEGTLAELYLRSRGITDSLPPTLRYSPTMRHGPTGLDLPCLIAAVTVEGDKRVSAVHRTFLSRTGTGRANIEPGKMALGPASGGSVRLAKATDELILGEGIETVLSAMQVANKPGWACLSTSGLMAVKLPPLPIARNVLIAADHDEPGLKAAKECAQRLTAEGRSVRIAKPPEPGMDFNDMLQKGVLRDVA